tara:strand:+ start:1072 stop:1218 length:147 start_codon:yes stop_codon:yes gene_type:complete
MKPTVKQHIEYRVSYNNSIDKAIETIEQLSMHLIALIDAIQALSDLKK